MDFRAFDVSLSNAAMSRRRNQPREPNPLIPKKNSELPKSRHFAAYSNLIFPCSVCVWLLSRQDFSKSPFHCSFLQFKGSARFVCRNLIYSLLCASGLYQGKTSARARFPRSILLLKGPARFVCLNLICSLLSVCVASTQARLQQGYLFIVHSSYSRALQGLHA